MGSQKKADKRMSCPVTNVERTLERKMKDPIFPIESLVIMGIVLVSMLALGIFA